MCNPFRNPLPVNIAEKEREREKASGPLEVKEFILDMKQRWASATIVLFHSLHLCYVSDRY